MELPLGRDNMYGPRGGGRSTNGSMNDGCEELRAAPLRAKESKEYHARGQLNRSQSLFINS